MIIAVYNALPYLDKCLDSLVGQSIGLGRLEIIAVDDGSTDGSGDRLDRLGRQHPQSVKVIHQANSGGPAVPSNRGLDIATGRYVFFIGADDYLGPQALARMVAAADKFDSDVVAGRMVGVNGRYVSKDIFSQTQVDVDLYHSSLPFAVSNTKLFRRELLEQHGIRYLENLSFGSDQPFTVAACVHAKRITVLADYDYYYAITRKSRSNITFRVTHEERLRCTAEIMAANARTLEPGPQRDAVIYRNFASEIWKLLQADFRKLDRDTQEQVCAGIAKLAEQYYTDWIASRLDVRRRVRITLAQHGLIEELVAVIRADGSKIGRPVVEENGNLYAAYDCFRDERLALPDSVFFITDDPAEMVAYQLRISSVKWVRSSGKAPVLTLRAMAPADLLNGVKINVHAGTVPGNVTVEQSDNGLAVLRAGIPLDRMAAVCRSVGDRFIVNIRVDRGTATCDIPLPVPGKIGKPEAHQRRGFRFFHAVPVRTRDAQLGIDLLPIEMSQVIAKARAKARRKLKSVLRSS